MDVVIGCWFWFSSWVHQSAKDKISKFSKDQNEIVRYHQFEVSEDDGKHIYQMSVIIDEALTKFSPMSDEMILLALYDELTLRDDYGDIKVYVEDPGLITDHNYYVLETGKIHFNYKKKVGDVEPLNGNFRMNWRRNCLTTSQSLPYFVAQEAGLDLK